MAAADEEEDIEFEYESDGEFYEEDAAADEQAILLENSFYEAQDMQLTHPKQALDLLCRVVERGEKATPAGTGTVWAFKALSNVVLIHLQLGDIDSASTTYERLLQLLQHVSRNEAADAISAVLEAVSSETETANARLQKQQQQQIIEQHQQNEASLLFRRGLSEGKEKEDEEVAYATSPHGDTRSRLHATAATKAAEATAAGAGGGATAAGAGGGATAAAAGGGERKGGKATAAPGGGGGGREALLGGNKSVNESGTLEGRSIITQRRGDDDDNERRKVATASAFAAVVAAENERLAKLEGMFTQTLEALRKHNVKAEHLLEELRVALCSEDTHQQQAATNAVAGGRGVVGGGGGGGGRLYPGNFNSSSSSSSSSRAEDIMLWSGEGREEFHGSGGGQLLLEYFALRMSLSLAREEKNASLKKLYQEALLLTRAIADPRSIALIREVGGRMHMKEKKWKAAALDFAEAFKNYQDIGRASQAKTMLQQLVLANFLSQAKINFFDTREAKALLDDPGVAAMHALSLAFETKNMNQAHELLTDPRHGLATDPSVNPYVAEVLKTLRLQVLPHIVAPYSCVTLQFLEEQLKTNRYEVLSCLSRAVGDGTLKGFVDDVEGVFWQYSKEEEEEGAGAVDSSGVGQEILLSTAAVLQQQQPSALQQARIPEAGVQKPEDVWLEAVKLLVAKLNRLRVT